MQDYIKKWQDSIIEQFDKAVKDQIKELDRIKVLEHPSYAFPAEDIEFEMVQ